MRHYIAVGKVVAMIEARAYEEAGEKLVEGSLGTILAFNPLEDSLTELLKVISGFESKVLTTVELDELMKHVQIERPIYTVDYKSIPYEKVSTFFTEASIKELTSKNILKCN